MRHPRTQAQRDGRFLLFTKVFLAHFFKKMLCFPLHKKVCVRLGFLWLLSFLETLEL